MEEQPRYSFHIWHNRARSARAEYRTTSLLDNGPGLGLVTQVKNGDPSVATCSKRLHRGTTNYGGWRRRLLILMYKDDQPQLTVTS